MKQCSRCKEWKDKGDFFKNKGTKDGLASNCKKCKDETTKIWEKSPAGIESVKRRKQKYRQSEKGKIKEKVYNRTSPEKRRAREAVHHAIERGEISPAKTFQCDDCNNQATQYHHYNGYNKENWFDIIPVCAKCHAKKHQTLPVA